MSFIKQITLKDKKLQEVKLKKKEGYIILIELNPGI